MQYKLGSDADGHDLIPDAVVFVKDKIIPIDSKFSLENYNRLVEESNQSEKDRLEKEKLERDKAEAAKAKSAAQTDDTKASFESDPCKGKSARFLSTCR